jgi:hypothetical protein
MKVIKLNRRFNVFKEHGHETAVRFSSYGAKASALERVCRDRFGDNVVWNKNGTWHGWFGKKRSGMHHSPYFISFRKESDLSFVLIAMETPL